MTDFELIKWSVAFFPLWVSATASTPNYSRKRNFLGQNPGKEVWVVKEKKGWFNLSQARIQRLESHTEWKYEKLIKATRGIERPKDDKLRKEMAKTCWSPRSPRGGATEQIR